MAVLDIVFFRFNIKNNKETLHEKYLQTNEQPKKKEYKNTFNRG